MRNKIITILMTFIFCFNAIANPTDGYVRSSIYELEAQVSQNLIDRISQFSGMENIWITVKLHVNDAELRKHLTEKGPSGKEGSKKEKFDSLPGLNLGPDGAMVKGENREIMVIDNGQNAVESASILAFTTGMDVTVYHRGPIQKKVERLIRSLIEEKISSLNIPVDVKFNHRKARSLEGSDLANGQKIRFESESFATGLQKGVISSSESILENSSLKYWPYIILVMIVLSLGAVLFMANKAMTDISAVLSSISRAIAAHSSTGNFEAKESTLVTEESSNAGLGTGTPQNELDVRQKISELYENHAEAISNFIINAMDNKDFHDIWCLSQVLGDKLFFENANITKSKNFKQYNTFLRDNLFSESGPAEYKRLYQKLMGLMLYPNVYFLNSIKKKTDLLSLQDMGVLFQSLSQGEKGVFSEIMDPMKLATLINQGAIKVSDIIDSRNSEIEVSTLKKLDHKVAEFHGKQDNVANEKILNILTYLSQEQYEMHIDAWGMDDAFRFEDLYASKKTAVHEFMKSMKVEELSALLPMLSAELQADIEAALPAIKLARILQAGKTLTVQSPMLMSKLFMVLLDQELRTKFLDKLTKNTKKSTLSAVA